eukprot:1152695-Pelagomonas_calceolata.AAC.3
MQPPLRAKHILKMWPGFKYICINHACLGNVLDMPMHPLDHKGTACMLFFQPQVFILTLPPVQTAPNHFPFPLLDKLNNHILVHQSHSCLASTGVPPSVCAAANDTRPPAKHVHKTLAQE